MAFVNEFVSEEEIAKYGLDALMTKHDQFGWQWGRPPGFRHYWTIDRQRSITLLVLKKITRVGVSGNPEATSGRLFRLIVESRNYDFNLDRAPGGSVSIDEVPYRIVWKIVSTQVTFNSSEESASVLSLLKESLVTFGAAGAWGQVANTQVDFTF